jgi:uncharacterized protein YndB with AHSA1/START domain/DNA-binding transcriptional ArsR family regulator
MATVDPMVPVFRALSDPSRRLLLDRLFERDGQTLGELCSYLPEMTRFGVMRHLDVLESADLISTRREGREKRHFLNPVPIRRLHDRWISKYAEPIVGAMSAMKHLLEEPMIATKPEIEPMTTEHVYSVFIQAPAERVWKAITDGDETVQYYYGTRVDSTWKPGAPLVYTYPDGTTAADGKVLEIDPPKRLRMTFHARWDPESEADGPVEMAWVLDDSDGPTKLTVTTSGLKAGSKSAEEFAGGIVYIVSGLKTLVETGQPMASGTAG